MPESNTATFPPKDQILRCRVDIVLFVMAAQLPNAYLMRQPTTFFVLVLGLGAIAVQNAGAQAEAEIDKNSISVHRVRRGDMPIRLMPSGEIISLAPPEVTVTVPSGTTPSPQVGQRAFVQVNGEFARRTMVRFGRQSGGLIQIISGLLPDDLVIVTDTAKWDSHERVRLR